MEAGRVGQKQTKKNTLVDRHLQSQHRGGESSDVVEPQLPSSFINMLAIDAGSFPTSTGGGVGVGSLSSLALAEGISPQILH